MACPPPPRRRHAQRRRRVRHRPPLRLNYFLYFAATLCLLTQPSLLPSAMSLSTRPPPFPLAGKRALVTGSSGGIGAGIARALAVSGARVLVHYNVRKDGARKTCDDVRDAAAAAGSGGGCDGILRCDFRSPEAIDRMFDLVDGVWGGDKDGGGAGGIDALVNNAGVVTKLAAEDDDSAMSAWHETMAVNLHAPLRLSRLAYDRMRRERRRHCQRLVDSRDEVGRVHDCVRGVQGGSGFAHEGVGG